MQEIRNSDKLRVVLEAMLVVGNYCNGGGARGGAAGFRLPLLERAIETPSWDPKVLLLHDALLERHFTLF